MRNKTRLIIGGICIVVGLLLMFQREIRVAYHEWGFLSVEKKMVDPAYSDWEDQDYLYQRMEYHIDGLVKLDELLLGGVELRIPEGGDDLQALQADIDAFMVGDEVVKMYFRHPSVRRTYVEAWYPPSKQAEWDALRVKWTEKYNPKVADYYSEK